MPAENCFPDTTPLVPGPETGPPGSSPKVPFSSADRSPGSPLPGRRPSPIPALPAAFACALCFALSIGSAGTLVASDSPTGLERESAQHGLADSSGSRHTATQADTLDLFFHLFREFKYREAASLIPRLLPYAEGELGDSSEEFANLLDRMVGSLFQSGRDQDPETYAIAERSLAIKMSLFGGSDARTVRSLYNIGILNAMAGHLDVADSLFAAGLGILDQLDSPDPAEVARVLGYLANVRQMRLDVRSAISLNRRSLELQEQLYGARSIYTNTTRSNLASLLTSVCEYAEARELLDLQIDILESAGREGEELARVYAFLADVNEMIGDHGETLRLQMRALEIREAAHAPDHPMLILNRLMVGTTLGILGHLDESYDTIKQAREDWLQHRGPDDTYTPNFDRDLGKTLKRMGRLSEAHAVLTRAMEGSAGISGCDSPRTIGILVMLARLMMQQGDHAAAREALTRAIEAYGRTMGSGHPVVGTYGDLLARACFLEGDYTDAFVQALVAERIITQHTRLASRSLPERQALLNARRRGTPLDLALSLAEAVPMPEAGVQLWDAVIRSRSVVLDEMAGRNRRPAGDPEAEALWEDYQAASGKLANLFLRDPGGSDPERHRQMIDDARRAMEEAQRRLPGSEEGRDWLVRSEEIGWPDVREALPPGAALLSYVLHRQYDFADTGTAVDIDGTPISGTALRYRAFVLPPGSGEPVVLDLGDAGEVDALIAEWQREASLGALYADRNAAESILAYNSAAGSLRERIWDPAASLLEGATRVFVVPDAQIHLVNLASLPSADGRYLIESEVAIHYLTAERDLARPPASGGRDGVLVLGSPDFENAGDPALASGYTAVEWAVEPMFASAFRSTPLECDYLAALRFAPLPAALEEAREVAGLWESGLSSQVHESLPEAAPRVLLLTGSAASERAFKCLAPKAGVVHVATHGYFLHSHCPPGFTGTRGIGLLIPEPMQGQLPDPLSTSAAVNPLLFSGLALAGANQREIAPRDGEDGILTAQEIAALDLSGVRWAVLSACETGTGQVVSGEGIFGLRRAFEIAGAGTLVTSLWSVRDQAARDWMNTFYRAAMEQRLSPSEAARSASLAALEAGRERGEIPHPSDWAAFIVSGDWR